MRSSSRERRRSIGLLLFGTLALAPPAAAQDGLSIAVSSLAGGFDRPLAIVDAGDGSGRLFVAQQEGLIRVLLGGQILPTPYLDLTAVTLCCSGPGFLGLTFDPDYENNGYFYVNHIDLNGDSVLARYTVSAFDPDVADPGSVSTLLEVAQPAHNHNNDHLAFGPDGYLYVAMGDGGSGSSDRGQDLTSLLGKLLRINPHGDDFPTEPNRNYAIPPDNPFVGDPDARDEIWAYGLRNPWRFSFDRELGDLWLGDVGAQSIEEIDFQPAASAGGENYGWALMQGSECFDPPEDCNDGSLVLPILEYTHDFGGCAVTGGYRYRGDLHPRLRGVYFYADFCTGTIWGTVPRCDGVWESRELLESGLSISSFGEDQSGELYLAHLVNNTGEVYRLATEGSGGPLLASSASTLDFGTLMPGEEATLPITLTNGNPGPEAVTLESLALSDTVRFSLDLSAGASPCGELPICLPPGAGCTAEVAFSSIGGDFDERLLAEGNFDALEVPLLATVPCGGSDDLVVENTTIDTTTEFVGCESVTIGPSVLVEATANVAFRAGGELRIFDGLTVEPGAGLRLETDSSLLP